ncbi:UPF0187-domain-containing protein [Violaceomyces palustris]|uniref:UPF0187-domain-containing protein n=1 Tax=Violaceomyces palustris TaxID=1673888 RepID=A0ACD0NQE9_9BASI|nr:UPF0187-domain-containing protein [Violaceomyces palustris]
MDTKDDRKDALLAEGVENSGNGSSGRGGPSSFLPIPDPSSLLALSLFRQQREKEGRRLKLSRMSFVKDAWRISGSVLPRILPSVLVITFYASFIALADIVWGQNWKTSNSVIGPLSVVVGLLIVFRNGTSYDRWYEGRKDWQQATADALNLARFLWLNVDIHAPPPPSAKNPKVGGGEANQGGDGKRFSPRSRLARKKRAMRLISSLMIAIKHHLRNETGTGWPDFEGVLPEDLVTSHHRTTVREARIEGLLAPGDRIRGLEEDAESTASMEDRIWSGEAVVSTGGSSNAEAAHDGPHPATTAWNSDLEANRDPGSRRIKRGARKTIRNTGDEMEPLLKEAKNEQRECGGGMGASSPSSNFQRMSSHVSIRSAYAATGASSHRPFPTPTSPKPLAPPKRRGEDLGPVPELALPHIILSELGAYATGARRSGMLDDAGPAGFSMVNTLLNSLTAQVGAMERVATATIPAVYSIHMKHSILLYLCALPLTLVGELSWRMIPVVSLVAFTLIGLEGISSEIEDPFGDDPSDHPLDLFCSTVRYDIEQIMQIVPEEIRLE